VEIEAAENKSTALVAFNENEQRGEKIYCTMLFKFGFASSCAISLSNDREVLINSAAALLFTEYVLDVLQQQAIDGKCFAQTSAVTIHFDSLHSNMLPNLENLFNALFLKKIDGKEGFEVLKEKALKIFSNRCANAKYKAYLKTLEFCAYESQFSIEGLTKSLEEITFEEYLFFGEKMLHSGNLIVFLDGKTEGLSQTAILDLLPANFTNNVGKDWSVVSVPSIAAISNDGYFAEFFGSEEVYSFALKFYFGEVSPDDMFIFLLFASVALDTPATIMFDGHTPSIMFFTREEYKVDLDLLRNLDEERFESLKFGCEMLLSATLNDPQGFGDIVVQALSQEVSIFDIFAGFASAGFEDVVGFIEDEYPLIRVGEVHAKSV